MFSFSACGDGVELGKGEESRLINGISQSMRESDQRIINSQLHICGCSDYTVHSNQSQGHTK